MRRMIVLGIETSCDETGVAVYDTGAGLRAHALHSQVALHEAYGGVVPELASRDHVRRLVPLIRRVLADAGLCLPDLDGIAYTQGPGLAGALLVGASVANALGFALGKPVVGIHHLEGHLLSPLLSRPRPSFPFVALLVSGGHSQLFEVTGVGEYRLLGDTLDDAAGEAFDKTAKLLGLPYPGGPALAALADDGRAGAATLPRPMLDSGDLDFSFSGLKTAVMMLARKQAGQVGQPGQPGQGGQVGPVGQGGQGGQGGQVGQVGQVGQGDPAALPRARKADIAREFQSAVVDVLAAKAFAALDFTGHRRLVVAGGVGANRALRERLHADALRSGVDVFFPELAFCTDNGAMIALAGALRLQHGGSAAAGFTVRPRWELRALAAARPAGSPSAEETGLRRP
jgi:N6-L-threonylcarbamoyladenine synthase